MLLLLFWFRMVRSPDGLVQHREVKALLTRTLCMVHLKSSDAPGYALYEALASGCPIIVSRKLAWKNRMGDLLEPSVTCLAFDRETHDPFAPGEVEQYVGEINEHMQQLRYPAVNRKIGEAGRQRLLDLVWKSTSAVDVGSLHDFWRRNFG